MSGKGEVFLVCAVAMGAALLSGCGGKREAGLSAAAAGMPASTTAHADVAEAAPSAAEPEAAESTADVPDADTGANASGHADDRDEQVPVVRPAPAQPAKHSPDARPHTDGARAASAAHVDGPEGAKSSGQSAATPEPPASAEAAPVEAEGETQSETVTAPEETGWPKAVKDDDCGPAG